MDLSWTSLTVLLPVSIVTLVLGSLIMGLFGGNKMDVDGKTVLITGGSEGMGLSVAKKLSAKGASIVIVSRSVGKLEAALSEIKAAAKNPESQRFHYISADVAAHSYAGPVLAETISWNHGKSPDIVWCIAGMSRPELFVDMPMESLRRHMDINFYGTAELSHAILREWLAPEAPVDQPRHLIMTSSVAAFYTIAGYGPYSPAKFALRGMADTISQELLLYPQDVKVHVVHPGNFLSPGHVVENITKPGITHLLESDDPQQEPDEVAEKCIRGLEKGQYFVTVAFLGSLMKFGVLGGSFRNNVIVDFFGAILAAIVWLFVLPDQRGRILKYSKQHGHPNTWKKDQAA